MQRAMRLPGQALDALGLLLPVLPLLLIHARGVAEGVLSAVAALYLLDALLTRDLRRFGGAHALLPLLWCGCLAAATLLAAPSLLGQALAVLRIPVAILALGQRCLASEAARERLRWGLLVAVAWIGVEVWLQFGFGRGVLGFRRWPAGELPGPFTRPRAGAFLVRAVWPVLVPMVASGLARGGLARIGAVLAPAFVLATLALIGQRLPLVFGLFGAGIAALLLPGLRGPAILGALAGAAALGATALVAPHAAERMLGTFAQTLWSFGDSHYGQILARSLAISAEHPWTGAGIDGFRRLCGEARFFEGWSPGSDGGGAAICVPHPHNPYLQALLDAGWPGLLAFGLAVLAWTWPVGRSVWRAADPRRALRIGLLVSLVVHLWPVASTSSFTTQPLAGLFVVLAGWALAEARAAGTTRA